MKKIFACFALMVCGAVGFAGPAETLGPRILRGYGKMAAVREGGDVVLKAESVEKAKLWIARFLKVYAPYVVKRGVVKFPDGGYVAVSRDGQKVRFAYSAREPESRLAEDPVPIPMFLNYWDDNSFKFYYRPGERPKGAKPEDYDPETEFDFMKACGNAGVVFWLSSQNGDYSKGMSNDNEWNWAKRLADARGLGVALNTDIGLSSAFSLGNEYAEELQTHAPYFMGSYHSIGEPGHAGQPFLSWASENARRASIANLLKMVKNHNTSNVVDLLEPHGELYHGRYTFLTEYGPLVDRSFRQYLKEKYRRVDVVARRWADKKIRSWDDCRLPEFAEFAGWDEDAVDLAGSWRGKYLEPADKTQRYPDVYRQVRDMPKPEDVPAEWMAEDFDDSAWPLYFRQMPGHEQTFFTVKRPAVLRRTFELKEKKPGRTWLYLWDLSNAFRQRVAVWVNGKCVGADTVRHYFNHWMVVDVTDALKAGRNTLALELPEANIAYRIYLTNKTPSAYPYFAGGLNAKWVDFCGWQEWIRGRDVGMALEMIRAVEPDKNIISMAPGNFANTLRELAKKYGTRFHDTGGTGASWQEVLPMLMQSADLPFTVEPGGPARDLAGFKRLFMLYMKTGINAVHYFIHVGNIMWNEEIRAEFTRILPAIRMMGRMEKPRSDIALVLDSQIDALMGYPWRNDVASAYPSGYGSWCFNVPLKLDFQMDAITPHDFEDGNAARYPFLIDANNTIMTRGQVDRIEKYVRDGGTYVAMFQSGRHLPEKPDVWMLKDLTGCELAAMTHYSYEPDSHGILRIKASPRFVMNFVETNGLVHARGVGRRTIHADGAKFRPVKDDVRVIATWDDGTAAVTERRIGKGRIILFGVRPHAMWHTPESQFLGEILAELGARKIPLRLLGPKAHKLHPRHYVTTDGLKDVWLITGSESVAETNEYEFAFRDGKARVLTDVLTGKVVPSRGVIPGAGWILATSPRGENDKAAWRWLRNQFGWWQGGGRKGESGKWKVESGELDVLDLSEGWTVGDGTNRVTAALGAWLRGRDFAPENYVCEKTITVPANWTNGDVELWGVGQYGFMFNRGFLGVRLNGRQIRHPAKAGITGLVLPLKPGETATLAFEVTKDDRAKVRGFGGPCYLYFRPKATREVSLAGEWDVFETMTDTETGKVTLPGKYGKALALRRTFTLPRLAPGERVRIDYTSVRDAFTGVIVNGTYIRRHHHRFGDRTWLDITPHVKRDGANEIYLVSRFPGLQSGAVEDVKLGFYKDENK